MTIDDDALGGQGLLRLMSWLSPSFPVGAYTYSHGVEYAIEGGMVTSGSSLTNWIGTILTLGSGRVDADLFREAWLAMRDGEMERLVEIAEWAAALRGTSEMALEASAQGKAFKSAVEKAWPDQEMIMAFGILEEASIELSYPIAVAVAAAAVDVPIRPALQAYLHAFVANLISAGVRLVPLGQTDGMRAVAALEPVVIQMAEEALERDFGDLGAAVPMVDWTSMQHETQYTRLFRS